MEKFETTRAARISGIGDEGSMWKVEFLDYMRDSVNSNMWWLLCVSEMYSTGTKALGVLEHV